MAEPIAEVWLVRDPNGDPTPMRYPLSLTEAESIITPEMRAVGYTLERLPIATPHMLRCVEICRALRLDLLALNEADFITRGITLKSLSQTRAKADELNAARAGEVK